MIDSRNHNRLVEDPRVRRRRGYARAIGTVLVVLASGGCSQAEESGQSRQDQIREVDIALKPLCVTYGDDPEGVAAQAAQITPVDVIHRRVIDGMQQFADLPDYSSTPEGDAQAEAVIDPLVDACYSLGERIVRTNPDYGIPNVPVPTYDIPPDQN